MPAASLRAGDRVRSHNGAVSIIQQIEFTAEVVTVYNLRVSVGHTYFVGEASWGWSLWAHNGDGEKCEKDEDSQAAPVDESAPAEDSQDEARATDQKPCEPEKQDGDGPKKKEEMQPGERDEYGELKKKTGHGKLDRHHIPDKASALARAEELKNAPLTKEEKARIISQIPAVAMPKALHQQTESYGENDTDVHEENAADLAGTAERQANEMVDLTKDESNAADYQSAAKDMTSYSNDDYDNLLRSCLDRYQNDGQPWG